MYHEQFLGLGFWMKVFVDLDDKKFIWYNKEGDKVPVGVLNFDFFCVTFNAYEN